MVSIDSAGSRTIYDVAVVSSPTRASAQDDSNRVARAKYSVYGASLSNPFNIKGDGVQPLVFHVTAGLTVSTQTFLWKLAALQIRKKSAATTGLADGMGARLQAFFWLTSECLRLLREGHYRVVRAAGPLAWQS